MDMNMCGLGVSLNKKIYYHRIVLSYNTPGETGCYNDTLLDINLGLRAK